VTAAQGSKERRLRRRSLDCESNPARAEVWAGSSPTGSSSAASRGTVYRRQREGSPGSVSRKMAVRPRDARSGLGGGYLAGAQRGHPDVIPYS